MKLKLSHLLFAAAMLAPSAMMSAHAAGAGGDPADRAGARITGSQDYIAVTGVHAPIAGVDGFRSLMALDAGIEIHDDRERRRAEAQMPRIRDALRRAVHGYLSMSYEVRTVPDLDMIGRRLQTAVDQVLGEGVAEVTIAAAIIHRNS